MSVTLSLAALLPVGARAAICGLAVWLVVRSVERAPPAVTAAIISLPMGVAAGFIAMAANQTDAFLSEAVRRGMLMLAGIFVYVAVAGRFFPRWPAPVLVGAATAAWALLALVAIRIEPPWPGGAGLALGAAVMAATHLIYPFRIALPARTAAGGPRRAVWPVAAQATVLVLLLSVFGMVLGPGLSAALASVPAVLIFITLALKRAQSPVWDATLQSARLGAPCLYAYLMGLDLLMPAVGGLTASVLAIGVSLLASALIVGIRLGFGRRGAAVTG